MNYKNDITMLVLTCDKYSELWGPLLTHYKKQWVDMPLKIAVTNNVAVDRSLDCQFCSVGPEKSWSDCVLRSLAKIHTNYVFCVFDDAFPSIKVDYSTVNNYLQFALDRKWSYLRLHNSPRNGEIYDHRFLRLLESSEYRTSLNFSLVKTTVLSELLDQSENPWEYERNSVSRSICFKDFFVVRHAIIPYRNLVVKGHYNETVKSSIEAEVGFSFELHRIPKMTRSAIWRRQAHEAAYRLKRACLDSVVSLLPR